MIKDVLLVGIGSFVGGSLRMVISKYLQLAVAGSFPLGNNGRQRAWLFPYRYLLFIIQ